MKKIMLMMLLLASGSLYAAAADANDDWTSESGQGDGPGSRSSTDVPDRHSAESPIVVPGGDDLGMGLAPEPSQIDDFTQRPESMAISHPLPSMLVLARRPSGSSVFGQQDPVILQPITVISFVNRAHNPVEIAVPDGMGGHTMYRVLGTKAQKEGGVQQINQMILPVSSRVARTDLNHMLKLFWSITKGRGDKCTIEYDPTGVYSRRLTREGKIGETTFLVHASDVARAMILVADHDKSIRLVTEDQLSTRKK
jgi:hypothetical protein